MEKNLRYARKINRFWGIKLSFWNLEQLQKFRLIHVVAIPLEKAMAPHSSTLAWKIPWTEEPGGLQSVESRRVRHDWATSLWLFTFMHWRRKWQPTPVFLPRESQGWGSLMGCHLWGRTESDMTERLHFHFVTIMEPRQLKLHLCHLTPPPNR